MLAQLLGLDAVDDAGGDGLVEVLRTWKAMVKSSLARTSLPWLSGVATMASLSGTWCHIARLYRRPSRQDAPQAVFLDQRQFFLAFDEFQFAGAAQIVDGGENLFLFRFRQGVEFVLVLIE